LQNTVTSKFVEDDEPLEIAEDVEQTEFAEDTEHAVMAEDDKPAEPDVPTDTARGILTAVLAETAKDAAPFEVVPSQEAESWEDSWEDESPFTIWQRIKYVAVSIYCHRVTAQLHLNKYYHYYYICIEFITLSLMLGKTGICSVMSNQYSQHV
jgi:hypothetical protein